MRISSRSYIEINSCISDRKYLSHSSKSIDRSNFIIECIPVCIGKCSRRIRIGDINPDLSIGIIICNRSYS